MRSGVEQQQDHAGPQRSVRSVGFEATTLRIFRRMLRAGRAAEGL